jgi:hypothetical protein
MSKMAQAWRQTAADGWLCAYVDDDGLPCIERVDHSGEHRDSGLRAWIESTDATAVVRVYEGDDATGAYAGEAGAFARHGWRVIAGEDSTRVVSVGPSRDQIALLGAGAVLLDNARGVRRITACFARPPLVAPDA